MRGESGTGEECVDREGCRKEGTKEGTKEQGSGVRKESVRRKGKKENVGRMIETAHGKATPPATGPRSLHSIDDVFPTSSGHPQQDNTSQLSQSCRERHQQRENILSTISTPSSARFDVWSGVSRDDVSPPTSLSPVNAPSSPPPSHSYDSSHLPVISTHPRTSMETTPGSPLRSSAACSNRPTTRN